MKVLYLDTSLIFDCVPREYPKNGDSLELILSNVLSKDIITTQVDFIVQEKLTISIAAQPVQFKSQDKYDITLKNGAKVIYKGQLTILDEDSETQNKANESQSTSRFEFRE